MCGSLLLSVWQLFASHTLSLSQSHLATLKNIRLASERTKTAVAVMLDTKGPEIRTGFLADHKAIELKAGQDLEIITDYSVCFSLALSPHAFV